MSFPDFMGLELENYSLFVAILNLMPIFAVKLQNWP